MDSDKNRQPKKERTEAQKRATASMLAKLKENREKGVSKPGRKKKEVKNAVVVDVPESESDEDVVRTPEKVIVKEVVKEVPVEPKYVTRDDLHAFKNELASLIRPPEPVVQEREIKRKPRVVKTDVVEQELPKPVKQSAPKSSLTGYSLLDALLNR